MINIFFGLIKKCMRAVLVYFINFKIFVSWQKRSMHILVGWSWTEKKNWVFYLSLDNFITDSNNCLVLCTRCPSWWRPLETKSVYRWWPPGTTLCSLWRSKSERGTRFILSAFFCFLPAFLKKIAFLYPSMHLSAYLCNIYLDLWRSLIFI